MPNRLSNGPAVPFDIAAFLGESLGLAFTWSVVARTTDGGQHWELVAVTPGELSRFHDVEIVP